MQFRRGFSSAGFSLCAVELGRALFVYGKHKVKTTQAEAYATKPDFIEDVIELGES
jgi:hypothetical protein